MARYANILETIGNTPIVKLNRLAPPGINVYVKIEAFNPMGSVKDRMARAIIERAEQSGALKPGQTVIEATSGNTGIGLAMVCAQKGYPLVVTMSESFSIERRKMLRFLGARVVLTPASEKGSGMLAKAVELAQTHGWFLCRQFENEANADVHSRTTAQEILRDFAGERLDYWVTGFGTGGTLKGVSRVLAKEMPDTKIVVCEPADAPMLSSGSKQERKPDGSPAEPNAAFKPHPMQGWSPDFVPKLTADAVAMEVIHRILTIAGPDAMKCSKDLATKEGIFVGITAGATLAGALQIAARSIAEALGIPYVFAACCPVTLPSADHPPPKMGTHYPQSLPATLNRLLWSADRRQWDVMFRATLNGERVKAGLAPINDVRPHIFNDRPWLAADPLIAPGRSMDGLQIMQTGAWMLPDRTPLPDDLERFLASGEPPVYFGFGSMRASGQTARLWLEAARSLGLRSIISQGWADLGAVDAGTDCIVIEEANHEKLFPRVAAVIHHGGAGTTTASVRAGRAQVIIPHLYDQYYWAHRVKKLGVGVAGPTSDRLNVNALIAGLRGALRPETTARADALADRIELNGARIAAERLVREFGPPGGTFI